MSFLNKNIISFEPKLIGLDLSDMSVKVFQIEKNGKKDSVRGYGAADIPEGAIEDGRIVDKNKVASIIKTLLKSGSAKKINSKKVICSLPESKAFVRIITIPKMNEDEAEEAVKWEMEASMPMSLEEVYYDWQFLEESDGKTQRVLTAAVSKEIIGAWMDVLTTADLDVFGLEIESIATIRSLVEKDAKKEDISLIVDLGAKRTSFIISEGTVPYFTSSIPFSSEGINDAISKALNISDEEAEKIKIKDGIEGFNESNPIFSSVNPLLENLVVEIMKTMDFYGEMSGQTGGVTRVILCGGGSNMKGMAQYLNQRIGKEVFLGNPWVNLNLGSDLPPIDKDGSVRYATAVGLALRGIEYGN